MASCNLNSRKQFHQEENRKIRAHENKFKDMVARWDVKTKDSPFRVNQFEKEERRLRAVAKREYNKSVEDYRNETIDSMIGTRRFDAYNIDTAYLVDDSTVKLALALRKQVNDNAIVKRERGTLDQMIDIQYSEMKQKFPTVEEFQSIVTTTSNGVPFHKGKAGLNGGRSFSSSSSRGGSHQSVPLTSTKRTLTGSGSNIINGKHSSATSRNSSPSVVSHNASFGDLNSLESGSGSIYRPPPPNAVAVFARELDAQFDKVV